VSLLSLYRSLNKASEIAFPCATFPASLTYKWSPLWQLGNICARWSGSRTAWSKSITPSNSPLLWNRRADDADSRFVSASYKQLAIADVTPSRIPPWSTWKPLA